MPARSRTRKSGSSTTSARWTPASPGSASVSPSGPTLTAQIRPPGRARSARAGACSITRATAPGRLLPGTSHAIGKHHRGRRSAPASHPSSCQSATPRRSVAAARWATTRRSRDWRGAGRSFGSVVDLLSLRGGLRRRPRDCVARVESDVARRQARRRAWLPIAEATAGRIGAPGRRRSDGERRADRVWLRWRSIDGESGSLALVLDGVGCRAMDSDADASSEDLSANQRSGVSPDVVRSYRYQLTPGEDVIDTATWAGSVPQVNGIAPRVRIGREPMVQPALAVADRLPFVDRLGGCRQGSAR